MQHKTPTTRRIISAERIRRVEQPVIVDCASTADGDHPIAVVPLVDGDTIAGLEVRCKCGATVVIDCVYEEQP